MKFSEIQKMPTVLEQIDKICKKFCQEKVNILDRTSVSDNPTGQRTTNSEIITRIPVKGLDDFLFWSLLLPFLPKQYQALVQLELEIRYLVKISDLKKRELCSASLLDRDILLTVIFNRYRNTDELFGWLKQRRELKIEIFYRTNKDSNVYLPVNHSRHRGYRDKGSLGDGLHLEQEYYADVWLAQAEEVFLNKQKLQKDLTSFIQETELFG